ncbi:MAG: DUF4097 family beta strand repeat-containing protein [Acidimicrobiia bacterium]
MIEETFSLTGPASVECSFAAGSLTVESGPPGSMSVTIDTTRPDSWRLSQTGDQISIVYERGFLSGGGRAQIRITVPAGSSLNLGTASADVRSSAGLDRVSISTASGNIDLSEVATVSIKTASGDVYIDRVRGDLNVKSASGDIRAGHVDGTTSITTASGDLSIEVAHGPLSVTTASGDVRVDRYMGDDVEASTMSGDLVVALPRGVSVTLKAHTLSGKVHLPQRRTAPKGGSRPVSVRAKSVSGDIRIKRLD